jgi:hypothetical protein
MINTLQVIVDGEMTVVDHDGQHSLSKKCGKAVDLWPNVFTIEIFYLPRKGKPQLEVTYMGPDTYFLEVPTC